jgi:hypothetical protein
VEDNIVLDYRTDPADPRVVASDWSQPKLASPGWKLVSERFSDFVRHCGI